MRMHSRGVVAAMTLVACLALPGIALAGTLVVRNPTTLDAWITIQNAAKTSNIAAFRVASGHNYEWEAPQTSVYGKTDTVIYVRFQFMKGKDVVCDTKGSTLVPARGYQRAEGYYQPHPNHCHIKF